MLRTYLLAILGLTACALAGCGGVKLVPVEGTVKMDGKPVDGATVTFISDDGKATFSGTTDSAGHFVLQAGEKIGAYPGNYKVTVVKNPNKQSAEAVDPSEAMKQMKKDQEDANKAQKGKGGSSGSDPMSKMKMGAGGPGGPTAAAPGVEKTELPAVYANGGTTTLTATVPAAGAPAVELELKSKGK